MLKLFVPLIVVLVLVGGGFYFYQNFKTKPIYQPTPSPETAVTPILPIQGSTPSPMAKSDTCEVLTKGSADVPPLYKEGVSWQVPMITEYDVPLGEEGIKKVKGCLISSEQNSEDLILKASGYLDDNLQQKGWRILVTASGSFSGTDSYRKDNKLFVARHFVVLGTSPQAINPPILLELFYAQ